MSHVPCLIGNIDIGPYRVSDLRRVTYDGNFKREFSLNNGLIIESWGSSRLQAPISQPPFYYKYSRYSQRFINKQRRQFMDLIFGVGVEYDRIIPDPFIRKELINIFTEHYGHEELYLSIDGNETPLKMEDLRDCVSCPRYNDNLINAHCCLLAPIKHLKPTIFKLDFALKDVIQCEFS